MKPGDRIVVPAHVGAVGFTTLADLRRGIQILGEFMNPLVPAQPYEVLEVTGDGSAKLRYVGELGLGARQITSGPWRGGFGCGSVCWVDAGDLNVYVTKGDARG